MLLRKFIFILLMSISNFLFSMDKQEDNKLIGVQNLMDYTKIAVRDVANLIRNYSDGWQLVKTIEESVKKTTFSSCGKYLATHDGSTIKIWNFNTLNENYMSFIMQIEEAKGLYIKLIKFSENNKFLVYELDKLQMGHCHGSIIKIVDIKNRTTKLIDLEEEAINSISISKDSKTLIAVCNNFVESLDLYSTSNHNIKFFDMDSNSVDFKVLKFMENIIAISPCGKYSAIHSVNSSIITIVNIDEKSPNFIGTVKDKDNSIVKVINLKENNFPDDDELNINWLKYSQDGKYLFSINKAWDISSGKLILKTDYGLLESSPLTKQLFFTNFFLSLKNDEAENIFIYDPIAKKILDPIFNQVNKVSIVYDDNNSIDKQLLSLSFSPNGAILVGACGIFLKIWQNDALVLGSKKINHEHADQEIKDNNTQSDKNLTQVNANNYASNFSSCTCVLM